MGADLKRSPAGHRLWRAAAAGGVALGALIALWIALSPSAPWRTSPPSPLPIAASPLPVGRPAPDFTFPAFSGGTLELRALRGRPVLLNFWASWCAPCLAETPLLVRLHRIYGPRGVAFVGVDVADETADARRFLGQHHVDYTVVHAPDLTVMREYAVIGLPTTVLIGPDGIVVDKEVGGFIGPEGERVLRSRLERLIKSAAQ
jgi:cytochrome c biogenesis protein CcmG, thiol:disulfide interchange protein DsbE